jgi:hypothetical protein
MFTNWVRKLGGFVLLVWAGYVGFVAIKMSQAAIAPTMAEWGAFLEKAMWVAIALLAALGAKSIGTDAVNKIKSAKGAAVSEPVITQNP